MKYVIKFLFISILIVNAVSAQNQQTIMTYNLLNYPPVDTAARNTHLRTIFANVQPDILVVQEMISQDGVNGFLNNVLNSSSSGYSAGIFLNGPDTDNAIFYKSSVFTFLSNTPIPAFPRYINEFRLIHNIMGDTLIIYSVHLKANDTEDDRLLRAAEVDSLRKKTDALLPGTKFIVLGDFNIYNSNEPAYLKLINQTNPGYLIDPEPLAGNWNNSAYSSYHTQSTRTRSFDDGADGGLDDRFDMILLSQSVYDDGGITYVPGSTIPYGNDGNHYNDSINKPPNTAVGQEIADALHYSSDHLPVMASFNFSDPVELYLTAIIEGLFNGVTMVTDTITIELRNSASPYSLVDQANVLLNGNGEGTGRFFNAANETPYYIVIKHRNALETWSASPQTFMDDELTYDFTSSSNKAYGDNLKLKGNKWCIYSGDVNQDGFINVTDLNLVYSNNVSGLTGYNESDLNGDFFTEIEDLNIVFINDNSGVEKATPP
jgi:endonuclease/exonuclease/phosphatase family metal-dependent hydrolase